MPAASSPNGPMIEGVTTMRNLWLGGRANIGLCRGIALSSCPQPAA
jgi:hypothetical protein